MVFCQVCASAILHRALPRKNLSFFRRMEEAPSGKGAGLLLAPQEQEHQVGQGNEFMAIYKRGQIYWYKFTFNGEAIRESTRQKNQNTARQMEAAHRSSLAKGEVGIREKKTSPTLADFISQRFEPGAAASTSAKPGLDYCRPGMRTIQKHKPLANLRLNEITSERA